MDAFWHELLNIANRVTGLVTDRGLYTFWPYLLLSYLLAVVVVRWSRTYNTEGGNPGVRVALGMLFDRAVWLHPSAIADYWCSIINAILGAMMRTGGFVGGALTSLLLYGVLMQANGGEPLSLPAGPVALTIYTVLVLVWLDLSKYLSHYLLHRVPVLWEFHKVHHSAQVLTPFTYHRAHPCDFTFCEIITGLFAGASGAAALFVFGSQVEPLSILGLNVGLLLFYAFIANLRHIDVWVPFPGWLSRILISPAQHLIHHSNKPQHHGANYGVIFALWDWMYGTLYVPKSRETLSYGLVNGEDREYQSIEGLYLLPFKKVWARLFGRGEARAQDAQEQGTVS